MKEIPILFSAPMVRALRENRKTQTRRTRGLDEINAEPNAWVYCGIEAGEHVWASSPLASQHRIRCPYGVAGDRLWTRETWCTPDEWLPEKKSGTVGYNADGVCGYRFDDGSFMQHGRILEADGYSIAWPESGSDTLILKKYGGRWRPSIHMPRWASRDTLEVISARPERLHCITEADAKAEGCESTEITPDEVSDFQISDNAPELKRLSSKLGAGTFTAKFDFMMLWDSINGKTLPWSKNPWVWRVDFRRTES